MLTNNNRLIPFIAHQHLSLFLQLFLRLYWVDLKIHPRPHHWIHSIVFDISTEVRFRLCSFLVLPLVRWNNCFRRVILVGILKLNSKLGAFSVKPNSKTPHFYSHDTGYLAKIHVKLFRK
uniref:Uncharacterized protein n=1 Tax=Cacopsylla melanoneura TaxID=428564 RepID=A0A8D8YNY2_9HEMI